MSESTTKTTPRTLQEAVDSYLTALDSEPERDMWDTESGLEEPVATKSSSDWAHRARDEQVWAALADLRRVAAEGQK